MSHVTSTRDSQFIRTGMLLRRAARGVVRARCFSSAIDDALGVDDALRNRATELVAALRSRGFYSFPILTLPQTAAMRAEAAKLYAEGKFEQSYSEVNGVRVAKPGVHSIELDGDEWAACPSLLCYTREVLLTLPGLLNSEFETLRISERVYGTKLAVTLGGGARYPLHVDNVGLPDTRKLTAIVYLNPGWSDVPAPAGGGSNGGELRLWTTPEDCVDIGADGGVFVLFWSDQLPHEVLPCFEKSEAGHRYALTLWLVSENLAQIANDDHPLAPTRHALFPPLAQ